MADGQWTPSPDFNRLRTALLRQGEPDRVPLHDSVDVFLKKRFLGLQSADVERATSRMQTGGALPSAFGSWPAPGRRIGGRESAS